MHPSPAPFLPGEGGGGGGRGGITEKEMGDLFREFSFFMKNRLKSEIYNDKKVCKLKCFSLS